MRMLLLLGFGTLITGCGYISEEKMNSYLDSDGDGLDWPTDCDDSDPNLSTPQKWYLDEDGDGYGVEDNFVEACLAPEGSVTTLGDCDDADATVFPNAEDIPYDGIDSDCDGSNDCDLDKDGFDGSAEGSTPTEACPNASDCDDSDPTIFPDPSLSEVFFNGIDDDCNPATGDGDADGDGYWHQDYAEIVAERGFAPLDIPNGQAGGDCFDAIDLPVDGFNFQPLNGFDSITPENVNPAATDIFYDGIDQNCDGQSDFDQDGDGFLSSEWENGTATAGTDCVDSIDSVNYRDFGVLPVDIHPDATDVFYDGVDQDCNGSNDFDQDLDGFDISLIDCDGDGLSEEEACDFDGDGTDDFTGGDDCNDSDNTVSIDADEVVNDNIDQNCDGYEICYQDLDHDSFGTNQEVFSEELNCIGEGVSNVATDCDDDPVTGATIYPGAPEICDGIINNCNNTTLPIAETDDDGDFYVECAWGANTWIGDSNIIGGNDCLDSDPEQFPTQIWFPDLDGDNQGDINGAGVESCTQPADHVLNQTDCNDDPATGATIYTGAPEICDGIINDCDANSLSADEIDDDGDFYVECVWGASTWAGDSGILGGGDCDDDPANGLEIYPGATEEIADGVDQDCDLQELCYVDSDMDGFGDIAGATALSSSLDCSEIGFSDEATDCDDAIATTYPMAPETPDAIDENCDGLEASASNIETCSSVEAEGRYFLVCNAPFPWGEAYNICVAGGYAGLASIDSAEQNLAISDEITSTFNAQEWWNGYNDLLQDGSFMWGATFTTSAYEYWDTNTAQPDGGSVENCVQMGPILDTEGYLWQDMDCNTSAGFICSDASLTQQ